MARFVGIGLVAGAIVALAAACGGTVDGGGTEASMQAYQDCLRQQGVELPDMGSRPSGMPTARPSGARPSGTRPSGAPPSGGPDGGPGGGPGGGPPGGMGAPGGVDSQTWQKAQEACASVRPSELAGGGPGGRPGDGATAAYRNCLSERGVTLPADGRLNTADPAVAAAAEACAVLRPAATPSASG